MPDTRQSKAIAFANNLITAAQAAQAARANYDELVKQYNSEGFNTIWNALQTAVQNTDGSLGAADGSPVAGHPIDNRTYTDLKKAVTANMLTAFVTFMNDTANFLGNAAVTTANRSQTLDDLGA